MEPPAVACNFSSQIWPTSYLSGISHSTTTNIFSSLAAAYSDTIGVPAIISIELFPQLMALEGDRGAGPLLRSISGIATFSLPEAGFDIDSSDQIGAG
jgi:CTP:molybdopterin cytidylyltransferase MocA